MSVETHVRDALDRAETERADVEQKGAAFQKFRSAVREIEPTTGGGQSGGPMADGGTPVAATGYTGGGTQNTCERVREQFAETVGQVSDVAVADETAVEDSVKSSVRKSHSRSRPTQRVSSHRT